MIIETQRLILDEMTAADETALLGIFSHPDFFYAAALQDNIALEAAAKRYAGWAEESRTEQPRRSWFMSIRESLTYSYIGAVVLVDLELHPVHGRQIEVGYFIDILHQRKGYATEAALAMYNYGVYELKVESVYTTVAIANIPSQKILEKLGLQNIGFDMVSTYKDRKGNPASRYRYRQSNIQNSL
ncbi:GNAT family N-acetyltransferase [Parapedobacter koreensis]|uniref:Protein N-acetyltransferase, RimJ/RimL family n=1 Tax=Parapedobacter koreensis TaxID=332977 RepID=A0A1H7NN77_9SPHI|nr:GNAT family protein [Parapedobacter koreensis]SEL24417.1 Protein N-acetyltransferase, RimJ/RimL family [Parapedobacter koreensis]